MRTCVALILSLSLPLLAACGSGAPKGPGKDAEWNVTILGSQTAQGFGAGQGIMLKDGFVYLYGDVGGDQPGMIREYEIKGTGLELRLVSTGREIVCARGGVPIAPSPTGLTFHPEHGTFLGDTVRQQGVIFHIDFDRALQDGNLDNAVLNMVIDDAATNGTRPEFVNYNGSWLIATGDDGSRDNTLRLYDPHKLRTQSRVSRPDAVVASHASTPFVQTIHHNHATGETVLAQNQKQGLYYRLTRFRLAPGVDIKRLPVIDLPEPKDELEGFAWLSEDVFITLSASPTRNVHFMKIEKVLPPPPAGAAEPTPPESGPAGVDGAEPRPASFGEVESADERPESPDDATD